VLSVSTALLLVSVLLLAYAGRRLQWAAVIVAYCGVVLWLRRNRASWTHPTGGRLRIRPGGLLLVASSVLAVVGPLDVLFGAGPGLITAGTAAFVPSLILITTQRCNWG